nr:hypothetical protein [Candidatus Freyarchaeota archaeon]
MSSITPELYDLIVKLVDDRVKGINVEREVLDKLVIKVDQLVEAQKRTEERLKLESQCRTEKRLEQPAETQEKT